MNGAEVTRLPEGRPVSMNAPPETTRVLVVDDEEAVTELYSTWLGQEFDTRTAFDGEEALERMDESIDVVFLDRQMPGRSGDEVLDAIDERGYDCRVVMVTAVDPDFDIVEMPFDDYLTKPVTRSDLVDTVEEMLSREAYDDQIQEFFAVASKKATLEAEKNRAELEASEEYARISDRVDELGRAADETAAEVGDIESMLTDLPGDE